MTGNNPPPLRLHEDRELFREAVNFTAATTGFLPPLIEKDYFCTVVLQHLMAAIDALVFKGGTCLAKVHAGFYRVSEDIDLAIPMPVDATRAVRRRQALSAKDVLNSLVDVHPQFEVVEPLTGANDSAQYNGVVSYPSLLATQRQTIKVEISLREPLPTPPIVGSARTLLLNPVTGLEIVPPLQVACISADEAMAEKLRAALSRRDPAIRDFFDLDDAAHRRGVDLRSPGILALLQDKLAMPGNGAIDLSPQRVAALRAQVGPQLAPVLRPEDFDRFDLDRALTTAESVVEALRRGSR